MKEIHELAYKTKSALDKIENTEWYSRHLLHEIRCVAGECRRLHREFLKKRKLIKKQSNES